MGFIESNFSAAISQFSCSASHPTLTCCQHLDWTQRLNITNMASWTASEKDDEWVSLNLIMDNNEIDK